MEHRFGDVVLGFERLNDWRADGNRCVFEAHLWRGQIWRHEIRRFDPPEVAAADTCYVELTGDDAGAPDDAYGQALANALKLPVYFVFGIPNQPLFGMREDDLIAHTFEEYVASGDPEWPLLVPMVRSASCAIDVIGEWSFERYRKYVVGGASKRAWTSWLVAQIDDPRVVGIVPVVFDHLHMSAQIENQNRVWGALSPMLEDYTRRRLHELASVPEGEALVKFVDPWTGLRVQRAPALVVSGANDPYWTVDATRVFYGGLPRGSALQVVGNMGHSIGSWDYRLSTVGSFCARCAGVGVFPTVQFELEDRAEGLAIRGQSDLVPDSVRVWGGVSESKIFAQSEFFVDKLSLAEVMIPRRGGYAQAVFMEFEFGSDFGPVRVTSPAGIVPALG
jgi:PhoPQ-activated pathogenicity-related protein